MNRSKNSNKSLEQIIDDLRIENEKLRRENAELRRENEMFRRRIVELERRLGLDSSNSSKPPSSDGLKKMSRTRSLREKSGKNPGGQVGHKGACLQQVEAPDFIELHSLSRCPHCSTDLSNEPVVDHIKRQVFDIPEIKGPLVTEHQLEVKHCPKCRKKITVQTNNGIKAPVQYGPNVNAAAIYLNVVHLIPNKRTAQIMDDLFGTPISTAMVKNASALCYVNTKNTCEQIEKTLMVCPVKGADESGIRINGKTKWLHTLCNDTLVHYRVSDKRGDVPKDVKGVIIHDHFGSYYSQISNAQHALCNAHHLRELKAVIEIDKEPWARDMRRLLLLGHRKILENQKKIQDDWLKKYVTLYKKIIIDGLAFHERLGVLKKPQRGKIKRRPGHNLLIRLNERSEDVLRFLDDPQVPFTNNQSEQNIRMIKVKQKISGCFRTNKGADEFCAIRSYTATAQKQGVDILYALSSSFRGESIGLV